MAVLILPDEGVRLEAFEEAATWLGRRGIVHERWQALAPLPASASQEDVLAAYRHVLDPFMARHGYRTADVISVQPDTPGVDELRTKFTREHVHAEDEVRFFVEGRGLFWFHLEPGGQVALLDCGAGDLVSVPAGTRHWFDFGRPPHVRAIRMFTDPAGWVAEYTGSDIARRYLAP